MCLHHVSSVFKNISPKTFGPHCVFLVILFKSQAYINICSGYKQSACKIFALHLRVQARTRTQTSKVFN
jgi:hypothetical protein